MDRVRVTVRLGLDDTLQEWMPRVGSGVVRIDPLRFLAGCCKATKPGLALSVVYLSMFYCIVLY